MAEHTPKRDLTIDKIVDEASDIVRRQGADALTMRRLAEACQVTPMALYHHVEDKDAVLRLVLDEVIGEVLDVEFPGDADERIIAFCVALYTVMMNNPGVGRLWVTQGVTVPNMAKTTELGFALLADCGLEGGQIATALDCLVVYIVGGVGYNLSRPAGIRYELVAADEAIDTPMLDQLIDTYANRDPHNQFEMGVRALWRGLKPTMISGAS